MEWCILSRWERDSFNCKIPRATFGGTHTEHKNQWDICNHFVSRNAQHHLKFFAVISGGYPVGFYNAKPVAFAFTQATSWWGVTDYPLLPSLASEVLWDFWVCLWDYNQSIDTAQVLNIISKRLQVLISKDYYMDRLNPQVSWIKSSLLIVIHNFAHSWTFATTWIIK
jgi:hypothetical protein